MIKEYFANYFLHMSDVTDMQYNKMEVHQRHAEPWRVTLVDTGADTMTGGRLKRVASYIANENAFALHMEMVSAMLTSQNLLNFIIHMVCKPLLLLLIFQDASVH